MAAVVFEEATRTLLCGDLFTQPGAEHPALTSGDILGASEAMREGLDYWAHAAGTRPTLERLASLQATTLACMHGSAWTGDGAGLIRELADRLEVGELEPFRRSPYPRSAPPRGGRPGS